jgi:hypothetical protein
MGVRRDPILPPLGGFGRILYQAGVEIADATTRKTEGIRSKETVDRIAEGRMMNDETGKGGLVLTA